MLVRPHEGDAGFDVWLAKRSERSRFMPGASVFPGGAVDATDAGEAARRATFAYESDASDFALRHAALRELFEEAGILLVCRADGTRGDAPVADDLASMRRALHAGGESLDEMLLARNLRLDTRTLVPYSNWITPAAEPIRFDTHFFLGRAPADHDARDDAHELHDGSWREPRAALAAADEGAIVLTFPTRAHVERLARYGTLDELFAHAQERVIRPLEVTLAQAGDPLRFGRSSW